MLGHEVVKALTGFVFQDNALGQKAVAEGVGGGAFLPLRGDRPSGIGVKICRLDRKMLETRFLSSTTCGGVWLLILTPMGPRERAPLAREELIRLSELIVFPFTGYNGGV
jgi:hypothetical protein